MRREVWIAAGVLVPFAALVAAGFFFSSESKRVEVPPAPGEIVVPAPRAAAVLIEARDAGLVAVAAPVAEKLTGVVAIVTPQIRQCLLDQSPRGHSEVKVRFTPLVDGGFGDLVAETQDPYLAACVQDVFEEAGGTNAAGERTTHLFTSEP
jgi:hypothetical protein